MATVKIESTATRVKYSGWESSSTAVQHWKYYTRMLSMGQWIRLPSLKKSNRSRTYQSSANEPNAWVLASLHGFAAGLISWVSKAQTIAQSMFGFRAYAKSKTIPLIVQGQLVDAFKDTGSEKSCIDHAKALKLGLKLSYERDAQASFRLPNGKVISSVAVTQTKCFGKDNCSDLSFIGRFFVFQTLHFPMILGNDILDKEGEIKWSSFRGNEILMDFPGPGGRACYLEAILDTGADVNVISKKALTSLGYQPKPEPGADFVMANGRGIRSMGQVTLELCFPWSRAPQNVKFEVFEHLAVSVVIGVEIAVQARMSGWRWPRQFNLSEALVTHIIREDHRQVHLFRVIVNGKMLMGSADTGSDLNLSSPSAASSLTNASSMEECKLDITLVDGSKATITHSFKADLSPYSAPEEITKERIYVLEGLEPDIIISRTTLDRIGAFTRNRASFSELLDPSPLYNLNVAAYLSTSAAKLLHIFKTGRRAKSKTETSSSKPTLHILPSPSSTDSEFYATLKIVAAYETNRREKAKEEIARLTGIQRIIAEDAEKQRIDRYEAVLRRRLDERRQAANNGP